MSGALNLCSKVASIIPGGGLVSIVLDIGNAALGLVPGGGGGKAPAVNINLDGVRSEISSIKKETDEIKNALKEQGEQLQDIKSFEMIKEMNYMDGIENIRSAHSVFFSSSNFSLEKRVMQFESHSFELR